MTQFPRRKRRGGSWEERFVSHVYAHENGCWGFDGHHDRKGYARWKPTPNAPSLAHRWAYELLVGPIPDGLTIDHLCRNRSCVNPSHLQPVTQAENVRRSPLTMASINAAKTHCKRGHEFTPENTDTRPDGRRCRTCTKGLWRSVA